MLNFAPAIPSRADLDWCWYLRRLGQPGEALERVLHDIGVMHPGGWADWQPSVMTATGAPVEMLFSAATTDLQLMTEVSDPASDRTNRVAQVCKIMKELDGTPPPNALRDVISAAQGAGDLRFGAWLGLRHGPHGLRTRLYAELPAAATDLSELMWPAGFASMIETLGPDTRATMMEYDGVTGHVTLHFVAREASRSLLPILAEPAQVSPEILAMSIDGLVSQSPQAGMPAQELGFSYAMLGDAEPPLLTLYFFAPELFGSDVQISQRVKSCGGAALMGYAPLVDHLPPAPAGLSHQGTIGLTARQGAAPSLSISVAAPWNCACDVI